MMASSYTSSIRGNLRGTSSSSAAIHPSTSSAASEELQDIPFEEVEEIPRDINMPDLIELAKQRILYIQQHVGDNTETSEIEAILLSIDEFKAFKHKKDRPAVTEYLSLKTSLINILNKSHWQTAGLPILSDKEGLDRAYTNNENMYYDGDENFHTAGINSIKDLFINDLTIPLRFIRYTERYTKAHQLFTDNKKYYYHNFIS